MKLRVRIAWTDRSDQTLMKLAGWSAIAHAAALIVFSLLPRLAPPPAPPRAVIAEIVPASALFPQGRTGPMPTGPTPSQRAEAARKAVKPKTPPVEKAPAPVSNPQPTRPPAKPAKAAAPAAPAPAPEVADDEDDEPEAAQDEAAPDEPESRAETPAPAGGGDSGGVTFGGSGAAGGIPSIGSSAFPYDYYRSSLVGILRSNWRRPIAADSLSESLTCSVQFTILKSGIIQAPTLSQRSGNDALDQSALRAVYDSNPLPPLPFQYGHASVSAEVVFELTPD